MAAATTAGRAAACAIGDDLAACSCAAPLLLHLGDYVFRVPDCRVVVAGLCGRAPLAGVATVKLMGNHEQTMLDALGGEGAAMTDWMINGGGVALQSWGGDPGHNTRDMTPMPVPGRTHARFLHGLSLMHREGGYLFDHAGIKPGVAM